MLVNLLVSIYYQFSFLNNYQEIENYFDYFFLRVLISFAVNHFLYEQGWYNDNINDYKIN